jgi:hypothetical protein
LTVTANSNTKVYGQTFTPAATAFTTTALQNGETVGSVTEVSPVGAPATAAVPGPYAITPSAATGGTFTPSNYAITYLNGALTVIPPVVVPPTEVIPPPVVVTPPVATPPIALAAVPLAEPELPQIGPGPATETLHPGLNLTVVGTGVRMPPIVLAQRSPVPPPLIVPPAAAVPPEVTPPPIYVPPVRPPKPDRN